MRLKKVENASANDGSCGGKKKKKVRCYWCAGLDLMMVSDICAGHGRQAAAVGGGNSDDSNYDEWMIDNGAGFHVCTDWAVFTLMKENTLTFVS